MGDDKMEIITSQLKKLSKGEYGECIVEDLIAQQTINISLEDFEEIQEFMKWYNIEKETNQGKCDVNGR